MPFVYISISDEQAFGREFLEEMLNWCADHYKPEEIFEADVLADWAEENGWAQEEG